MTNNYRDFVSEIRNNVKNKYNFKKVFDKMYLYTDGNIMLYINHDDYEVYIYPDEVVSMKYNILCEEDYLKAIKDIRNHKFEKIINKL